MIVGLCGLQGSGKDTFADALVKHHGFVKLSSSAVLKDVVAVLFGWDREMLNGTTPASRAWREQEDVWWSSRLRKPGFTPRRALQELGTDVMRDHFHEDIWMIAFERQLEKYDRVVVNDCRFVNDIASLRGRGAKIVHITRGALPDWFLEAQRGVAPPACHHVTEWAWCREAFDAVVANDSSVEALEEEAAKFIRSL